MLEKEYQAQLIKRLSVVLPGCHIIVTDPVQLQGIPDLLILDITGRWAVLEVKRAADAKMRPNQDYYIEHFGEMAFSAFIYPENEEEVLIALQQALRG